MWACQPLPPQVAKPSPCHLCLTHIHSLRLKLPATHPITILASWNGVARTLEPYKSWCLNPASSFTSSPNKSLSPLRLHCLPAQRTRGAVQQAPSVQGCTSNVSWGNSTSDAVRNSEAHTSIDLQNFHFPGPPKTQGGWGTKLESPPGFWTLQLAPVSAPNIRALIGGHTSLRLTTAQSCWYESAEMLATSHRDIFRAPMKSVYSKELVFVRAGALSLDVTQDGLSQERSRNTKGWLPWLQCLRPLIPSIIWLSWQMIKLLLWSLLQQQQTLDKKIAWF